MVLEKLKEKVRRFPDQPGVYLLKDQDEQIIYVGKALSLRQRVRSYLVDNTAGSPRLKSLQANLHDIDYVVTDSEVEALILECSLIKEYRPRFNVNLKDDKDYPYLLITPELYPRLELLRLSQKKTKRGRFQPHPDREEKRFGPYTDVGAVRETMQFLGTLFPLRRCRQPLDGAPANERPCLNYQMKRCLAPCRGAEAVPPEEYYELVRQVELFLQGKHGELENGLKSKMEEAAVNQQFEEAAHLRDRLQALRRVAGQQQKMQLAENSPDRDVVALSRFQNRTAAHLFKIRQGKLLSQEHFTLAGADEVEDEEVIASFIKSYYNRAESIPREILLSGAPADQELISRWLKMKAGHTVNLRRPQRGELKKLVDLAARNALLRLEEEEARYLRATREPLIELGRLLGFAEPPERIEGYDISHLRGGMPVGAMVVFREGEPSPGDYRRFNIRRAPAGDDYAALSEVLQRRADRAEWLLPDLILIDGGRGQLNAARKALRGTVLDKTALISLAKDPDRLFLENSAVPARLTASDPLLQLLQRIRDEVHRFALGGHRLRKQKGSMQSALEKIPGVGPTRRTALLKHFGSLEQLKRASAADIAVVPGISSTLAGQILDFLSAES